MKEWTIMIYMAGDNNLAVDMAYALEQIKGVAGDGPDSPNLFVYYDGNSPSIPTLYCDFSDPKKPKYVRSFKVPKKLYDVPAKQNENAADKRSVVNFVDWCVNQVEVVGDKGEITNGRRSNKYALIFSGHSLGFQDVGLFKDETTGRTMKMKDLFVMLDRLVCTKADLKGYIEGFDLSDEELKRETTELLAQPLDLLGFDACVMGMLEVGYQFGTVAKTIIASEGSVPSAGWTYAKILGNLANEKDVDSNAVAERFVRNFIKSQDAFTVGGVSVDMAAWDLSKLQDLTLAFDDLSEVLLACFDDPQSRIYRQMARVILNVHWQCQSYMFDQNVDLGDFCELLDTECGFLIEELGGGEDTLILADLQTACRKVLDELNKAVILSGFSGGEYQYSNGISVFFPWSREGYEVSQKNYEGLFFVKDTGRAKKFKWPGFLRKYLNEVALRKFEPPVEVVAVGSKYRYYSGVKFDESSFVESVFEDENGSPEMDSKIAGSKDSKIAGSRDSKLAGSTDSKLAGSKDSKIAGSRDSKLAGSRDSKLAGSKDSKIAGSRDSKLAGSRDSKMGGGVGSDAFFDNLRMFKNIESRWDISGFTKKTADSEQDAESADATHA